ncbi:MAG TPA: putative sulfate exporter family transporter [Steroidobacteraceae bacterium]|nr:putative sulfate exporter family transporter [Steroidobacteraceae bacterium]
MKITGANTRLADSADWLTGVLGAAAVALLAMAVSNLLGVTVFHVRHSPVSPVMLAVVCGVALGQLPAVASRVRAGACFASCQILQLGIVLVGLKLSFASTLAIVGRALPVVAACLVVSSLVALLLARALGLRREFGLLIAIGTSVCGCTAVLASSPLLRVRKEEMGYAISCVVVMGLTGMLLYPWLAHASFAADPIAAGVFLGTSIHDTSQVMGAALLYSQTFAAPTALAAATVAKLLRNLTLVVLLPALAIRNSRQDRAENAEARTRKAGWWAQLGLLRSAIPPFVLLFILLVATRNLGDAAAAAGTIPGALWAQIGDAAARVSEYALTIGMAGVGLTLSVTELPRLGLRPFAVAAGAALVVLCASWLLTTAWRP